MPGFFIPTFGIQKSKQACNAIRKTNQAHINIFKTLHPTQKINPEASWTPPSRLESAYLVSLETFNLDWFFFVIALLLLYLQTSLDKATTSKFFWIELLAPYQEFLSFYLLPFFSLFFSSIFLCFSPLLWCSWVLFFIGIFRSPDGFVRVLTD